MMRYSIEPKFRKYVKGYRFLSFAKNFGNKYGKKLMDTATKTGMDAAKIASKRVLKASKITSISKRKEKSKPKEKPEEIYIPPEKRQQIIDDLRLFLKKCNTFV